MSDVTKAIMDAVRHLKTPKKIRSGRTIVKQTKEELLETAECHLLGLPDFDISELEPSEYYTKEHRICSTILECGAYHIYKDDLKIQFDLENHDGEVMEHDGYHFFGAICGGDWENPIAFFVYFDGKKFRAYIPENGNTFNKISRTAFGSEFEPEEQHSLVTKLVEILDAHGVDSDEHEDWIRRAGVWVLSEEETEFPSEDYELPDRPSTESMVEEFLIRTGIKA